MSWVQEFFEKEAQEEYKQKISDGYLLIPNELRPFFGGIRYIHKDILEKLKQFLLQEND